MSTIQRRQSALWTRLLCLLAAFFLLGCLQSAVVSASPTRLVIRQDGDSLPDDPGDVDPIQITGSPFDPAPLEDKEDKYPRLDECREKCSVAKDKSVFYSQVGKHEDKPADFASKEGLVMVRGISSFVDIWLLMPLTYAGMIRILTRQLYRILSFRLHGYKQCMEKFQAILQGLLYSLCREDLRNRSRTSAYEWRFARQTRLD